MHLHIVEPTLISQAGHCWGLAHLLAETHLEAKATLWIGRRAAALPAPPPGWTLRRWFFRSTRRVQYAWLLGSLLRAGNTVSTPTTSRSELAAFALLPRTWRMQGRAVFYVHQMRLDAHGQRKLQWLARHATGARLLATHPGLANALRKAGFPHVVHQPYPFLLPDTGKPAPFRHFIFPGMARMDKGVGTLAAIVELLARETNPPPLFIQAAPNHHDEYPSPVLEMIDRIRHHAWSGLTVLGKPLEDEDYRAQFSGAICLQPYDPSSYANKISSVTLDALAAGAPIIARAGLWSAEIVQRFNAGIVVEGTSPEAWAHAMKRAQRDYPLLQRHALQAAQELAQEHAPQRLWRRLLTDEDFA